jgi:hypothetical protein
MAHRSSLHFRGISTACKPLAAGQTKTHRYVLNKTAPDAISGAASFFANLKTAVVAGSKMAEVQRASELEMPLANLIRDTAHAVVEALGLEQKDVLVEAAPRGLARTAIEKAIRA